MIFLCYAKEDKAIVEQIYIDLRKAGLDPWMDKPPAPYRHLGIASGALWEYVVPEKIKAARYMLAFLSKGSVAKRGYVQREYRMALSLMNELPNGNIYLIPVLLEDCDLPTIRDGTIDFSSLQTFEWYQYGTQGLLVELAPEEKGRKILEMQSEARDLERAGLPFFASYFHLKSLYLHLRPPDVNVERAMSCARKALASIGGETRKSIYYFRTLRLFCKMWLSILDKFEERFGGEDLLGVFRDGEIFLWLSDGGGYKKDEVEMFQDMFFIRSQLDILEEVYVRAPAGLSTLRTCRLLLRSGLPPSLTGIKERLEKIRDELEAELKREVTSSLDGQCSLCTGVAAACGALAGREHKDMVELAFRWLEGLGEKRYSTRLGNADHALHYAAVVLEAFLDYGSADFSEVDAVVSKFFDVRRDGDGKYEWKDVWMKYRNIDRFEVFSFILPAFLRLKMAQYNLDGGLDILRQAIDELVGDLKSEAREAGVSAATLYASRENLASLFLGEFVGAEEAVSLAVDVASAFHARITERMKDVADVRLLWDSSPERTLTFIDAYLRYWESILALRE